MKKHDYLHLLKDINKHLHEAKTYSTQPQVLVHIDKAKDILWIIADDVGAKLLNEGD
jgi:hypothetical protein